MLDSATIRDSLYSKVKNHRNFREIKQCGTCKVEKSFTEFYVSSRASPAGYYLKHECRVCSKVRSRNSKWKRMYGVTSEEVFRLFESQNNSCKICKCKLTVPKFGKISKEMDVFHIDHDHKTGKFRGILCHTCNLGIAYFKDSPVFLREALVYLNA